MIGINFSFKHTSSLFNGLEDDLIFNLSKLENVNNRNRGVKEENENNITDEEESESEESENQKMIIMKETKSVT